MLAPKLNSKLCSPKQVALLGKTVSAAPHPNLHYTLVGCPAGLRLAASNPSPCQKRGLGQPRVFSTTSPARLRDFSPVKETGAVLHTPPLFPHRGYTEEQMLGVATGHRQPRTLGDKFAWRLIRIARWCMDRVTGLSKDQQTDTKNPTTSLTATKPLTEAQWLTRFIFLESIAAVPGMVAGMLRHLHSLRRLKRDNGWIELLLEEAFNERMHLLTFLKMCEPGWFMRFLILGAQGVYFNAMLISYLISPKICHRFVGYLEEEAVHTYTRSIRELEAGLLPKWSDPNFSVPDIAVSYWKMPEGHRTMRDLLLYIRADEANHRGVNHTLSNLNQTEDPNPFLGRDEHNDGKEKPSALFKPTGFEREEVISH